MLFFLGQENQGERVVRDNIVRPACLTIYLLPLSNGEQKKYSNKCILMIQFSKYQHRAPPENILLQRIPFRGG